MACMWIFVYLTSARAETISGFYRNDILMKTIVSLYHMFTEPIGYEHGSSDEEEDGVWDVMLPKNISPKAKQIVAKGKGVKSIFRAVNKIMYLEQFHSYQWL